MLPVLRGYDLHPSVNLKAGGPQDALDLTLDLKSEAGAIAGKLNADLEQPDLRARGTLDLSSLNLAPILQSAAQKSDITGHATVDLRVATAPADKPVLDRLRVTYAFQGPRVVAAGYRGDKVTAGERSTDVISPSTGVRMRTAGPRPPRGSSRRRRRVPCGSISRVPPRTWT